MMRLLPMPWSSVLVFVVWILIMGEISALVLFGALVFAIALPWVSRPFIPQVAGARNPGAIVRLMFVVVYDIVQSNLIVARLVLGDPAALKPTFVTVPVQTEHPFVVNLLASIITMTPGTVSARVHEGNGSGRASIVVHALDCDDEAALIADIKQRYEQPLLEIFGCQETR